MITACYGIIGINYQVFTVVDQVMSKQYDITIYNLAYILHK